MDISALLDAFNTLSENLLVTFGGVWDFVNQDISYVLGKIFGHTGVPVVDVLIDTLIQKGLIVFFDTFLPDVSLLAFMIGEGLTIYLAWQIVKWVLDILP